MIWSANKSTQSIGFGGKSYSAEVIDDVSYFVLPDDMTGDEMNAISSHGLKPVAKDHWPARFREAAAPANPIAPAGASQAPAGEPGGGTEASGEPAGDTKPDIDKMNEDELAEVAAALDIKIDRRWNEARVRDELRARAKDKGITL